MPGSGAFLFPFRDMRAPPLPRAGPRRECVRTGTGGSRSTPGLRGTVAADRGIHAGGLRDASHGEAPARARQMRSPVPVNPLHILESLKDGNQDTPPPLLDFPMMNQSLRMRFHHGCKDRRHETLQSPSQSEERAQAIRYRLRGPAGRGPPGIWSWMMRWYFAASPASMN